jgi:hypothetical protein
MGRSRGFDGDEVTTGKQYEARERFQHEWLKRRFKRRLIVEQMTVTDDDVNHVTLPLAMLNTDIIEGGEDEHGQIPCVRKDIEVVGSNGDRFTLTDYLRDPLTLDVDRVKFTRQGKE